MRLVRKRDGNRQHYMSSVSDEPAGFKYIRRCTETFYLNKNGENELS